MGDLEFIDRNRAGRQRALGAESQRDELQNINLRYLYDSTGSPLEQLLDSLQIELCAEFLAIMDRHDHVGAEELYLHKYRLFSHPSIEGWATEDGSSQPTETELWHGKGYYVGAIEDTRTYLCSDGSLRCERSQSMFPQEVTHTANDPPWASGVGTIPPQFTELEIGVLRHDDDLSDSRHPLPLETVLKLHLRLII